MASTRPAMASTRRPLIGVTSYRQPTRWWSWDRDAAVVPGVYLDMVVAAGGQPLVVPPAAETAAGGNGAEGSDPGRWDAVVAALDALVLTGGGDLDAARYGEPGDPRNGGTSPARDGLELDLTVAALAADLPLLAICRGHQVLNVALGGTLIQHLPDRLGTTDHQPAPGSFGPVEVDTVAGSVVRSLLGPTAQVLCSHHQAVDALGSGLVVTATSADGVVEAVELPGRRFAVGVQWHPEESADVRLFAGLVAAARPRPA